MAGFRSADIRRVCGIVRAAFKSHVHLRHGYSEKVYENDVAHRLPVAQQRVFQVRDVDGEVSGRYRADVFVEDCLIVEVNACRVLAAWHLSKVLG
ncbi:GxxExxY protein [bacterium]|nr:GxxExxY protein [candidate division CSSED10-310 bacterium]